MLEDENPLKSLTLERRIDAPIALVWQMWTDPGLYAQWYGPKGVSITVLEMDVRVGGTRFIRMEMATPNGPHLMWFIGEFTDVLAERRLVYTEAVANERGDVLDPQDLGMPSDHPKVTEIRVELAPDDNATRLVLTHVGIPADSPAGTGWTMALDKLTEQLATA